MQKYKRDWSEIGSVTVYVIVLNDWISPYKREIKNYASLEEALVEYCWYLTSPYARQSYPNTIYRFYDEIDLEIPRWKINEVLLNIYSKRPIAKWNRPRRFKFRNGPVERISSHYRGSGYRIPQTTQEIRENDFVDYYDEDCLEYGIKARRARTRMNIPSTWDDRHRGRQRSWKKQRKHQWKD